MILQLNPPLWLESEKASGYCHFVIDYGIEEHLIWVIFDDKTRQCFAVPNPEITIGSNWTMGRR